MPAGKDIHAIMDNDAAYKHPEVLTWLADHTRRTFDFTPTACSSLIAVEGFFARLTRQALRRGVFRYVDDLVAAIDRYVTSANDDPKPFVWTDSAVRILVKLKIHRALEDAVEVTHRRAPRRS